MLDPLLVTTKNNDLEKKNNLPTFKSCLNVQAGLKIKKTTTRKNNNLPTFKLCLNDQAGKKKTNNRYRTIFQCYVKLIDLNIDRLCGNCFRSSKEIKLTKLPQEEKKWFKNCHKIVKTGQVTVRLIPWFVQVNYVCSTTTKIITLQMTVQSHCVVN